MKFDTARAKVILPTAKQRSLQQKIGALIRHQNPSIRFAMKVLGGMVSSIEAIPFAQFHTRPLQQAILKSWDRTQWSLDRPLAFPPSLRKALEWWLVSPSVSQGKSFPPVSWTILTTDASLHGWGGVLLPHTVQGTWSTKEARLHINILELRAIFLSLLHWTQRLQGLPVRIQTDNVTAVAYLNHQGGTRSLAAMTESSKIFQWAETHVPLLSAVHIPGVENWTADFLSRERVDPGEWSLHPHVFEALCLRWGLPDVDLMASRFNHKVPVFLSRMRDPLSCGVDALVAPWQDFRLLYAFPPLPLLSKLLQRIKREGIPAILIAPDWPRRPWYADLVCLLADAPWPLPLRSDLLSQGPLFHQHLEPLRLTAWRLNPPS